MDWNKLLKILNPNPSIGGMEINDGEIKFAIVHGSDLVYFSLPLELGIVEGGKIIDKTKLSAVLIEAHNKITNKKKKKISVILSISDENVYAQVFNLPMVQEKGLEEAANLNLQIISPIDFKNAYTDWQKIEEITSGGGQIEILGVFAQKQIIDDYAECLENSGFSTAVIEFSSLGIARVCNNILPADKKSAPVLSIRISSGGISFTVVREGMLFFHRFVEWTTKQLSVTEFNKFLEQEGKKVLNFFSNRWGENPERIFVVAPNEAFENLTIDGIKNVLGAAAEKINFSNFNKDSFFSSVEKKLVSLSGDWSAIVGALLRAEISRAKDIIVSLAPSGTEQKFREGQILDFIKIWRNIFLAIFISLVICFGIFDTMIAENLKDFDENSKSLSNIPQAQTIKELQGKAEEFNKNIELGIKVKNLASPWSLFLETIMGLGGGDVLIDRIFIQSLEFPITISARAKNEQAILTFKEMLSKNKKFSNIDLPISSIAKTFGDMLSFTIQFKLKLEEFNR